MTAPEERIREAVWTAYSRAVVVACDKSGRFEIEARDPDSARFVAEDNLQIALHGAGYRIIDRERRQQTGGIDLTVEERSDA